MVSSSKILTVSYGTFSCTAEGFEDPLAVVKETTHFFRGVVGEDRFFGAEPPQFDADLATEMMRERLSPDMGSGTLSLGQGGPAGAASSGALAAAMATRKAAAARAADDLPDDDTIEATAVLTERRAETDDAADQTTAPEPDLTAAAIPGSADDTDDENAFDLGNVLTAAAPAAAPSDVAAKLDRIRAVVAGHAAQDAPEEDASADLPLAQDDGEDVDDDALAALLHDFEAADRDATELPEDVLPSADARDTDNLFADTLAGLMADQDEVAAAKPAPALELPDMDSAFAYEDDEDDVPGLVTPFASGGGDAFAAWDDDAEDDTPRDLGQDTPGNDASDAQAEDSLDADEEDDEDDYLEDDADYAEEATLVTPPPASPKPAIRARVVKVKRAVFEDAVKSGQIEEVVDEPAVPGDSSLSPEEEDELARELAAVTAELDNGWADNEDDEDDFLEPAPARAAAPAWDEDDTDEDEAPAAQAASAPLRLDNPVRRPSDDWADQKDAVTPRATATPALLDEDDGDDSIEAMVRDSARKAVKMASPARAMLTESAVEDNDTSRILDETNKELDEPEGSRRRTAIAHLRAAVAATRADKLLGRKATAEQETQPYREDLANVVRPRRPQAAPQPRSERPAETPARPAPLKLVAEQRIAQDTAPAQPQTVAPVRPRRIHRDVAARAQAAEADKDSGFADYPATVGAAELPELLEAAAAYMSFVEGREQFSRPQLMTTVRQAEARESSREDRLRSFGQLLREGKIEKTSGGRFTASERIAFKPDRAVG